MKVRAWLTFALTLAAWMTVAQNLLPDSVFSARGRRVCLPKGWRTHCGTGANAEIDVSVVREGRAAVRLAAKEGGTRAWNMVSHAVPGVQAKTPYTVSAWVKTQTLDPEALAYISLNCFSGAKRLAANDSPVKLKGTKDWTRLVFTLPELPPGTSEARFVFCLYGGGTAWCTQPQVEAGTQATPYVPTPEDAVRLERRARQEAAAAAWRTARNFGEGNVPRVAVLDLGFGVGTNAFGCMGDPAVFEQTLAKRYRVARVTGDELCDAAIFSRDTFDLLVVPTGAAFPAAAAGLLVDYLGEGGKLLTCGGYAFDQPVVKRGGAWVSPKAYAGAVPAGTVPLALPPPTGWSVGAGGGGTTVVEGVAGPHGAAGVRMATPAMLLWNTASAALSLKGHSLVSFLAKGDAGTKAGWFEVQERDGSRWRARLDFTSEWSEFRLTPAQFTYWPDNASVGRGRPGDHVDFAAVTRLSLGVALDIAPVQTPQGFAVCALKGGVDPHAAERCLGMPTINTRTGRIRDAIHPNPEQIQLFDPCETLLDVARTATDADMEGILPSLAWEGAMGGLSARAQLGVNGHGFGPNRCCWRPILACRAADGSLRGYAGALVHNDAGTFAGSSWAFFGVADRDLFPRGDGRADKLLTAVVEALLGDLHLCETTPRYSCYRVGETAQLRTQVANWGAAARNVMVRFRLADEAGRDVAQWTRAVRAAPGGLTPVEVAWTVPAAAPDFVDFTAELSELKSPEKEGASRASTASVSGSSTTGGRILDRERAALVVWTPAVVAAGPKVRREGLRLTLDGASRFFAGAQTFWGQHASVTARSPRRFRDDFRQMRAFGMRWTRCFLPCRTEAELRDSDAIVQLAQKYGLVLYHTPNLANTPSRAELDEEIARMKQICTRYRDVPGFVVDICNEPSLKMATPAFEAALGEKPNWTGKADDPAVLRTFTKATALQRRWAQELAEAARAVRPGTLLSVGWGQGWAGGAATKDPQVASLDLDFTDRHYYGPYENMMGHVKDIDLRVLGKPFLVGECGSKNHPTFQKEDPWGMKDDDAFYSTRFRYLYAHAFGGGATALLSWHWRDPVEGLFPCGLVLPSGIPRPTAFVVEKLARTFGKLELVDNPPDVVVLMDERMRHTTARAAATQAAWRVDDALLWWGANWSCLTSSRERDIPASVKLVIRPEGLDPATLRAEIGARLKASGASFTRRAGDPVTLETFRVPGKDATGWVFWNGGTGPVEVERGGYRLTVGALRVGYLQVAADGALQVKEEL